MGTHLFAFSQGMLSRSVEVSLSASCLRLLLCLHSSVGNNSLLFISDRAPSARTACLCFVTLSLGALFCRSHCVSLAPCCYICCGGLGPALARPTHRVFEGAAAASDWRYSSVSANCKIQVLTPLILFKSEDTQKHSRSSPYCSFGVTPQEIWTLAMGFVASSQVGNTFVVLKMPFITAIVDNLQGNVTSMCSPIS